MVAILVERDGMDEDEADEFLDFNCLGGYLGEHTPIFANLSGEMLPSPAVQAYDFGHENWII
jgi:hypothetical protein